MTLRLVTGGLGSPAERTRLDQPLPATLPPPSGRGPWTDSAPHVSEGLYSSPPEARGSMRVAAGACPGIRKLELLREVAPVSVWRAENADGEPVALVELAPDALPASRRRFLQDAAALARVTREAPNPALLQVHALAADGSSFVAELWDHGDLRDLVARGMTLQKKLGLVRRICAALTAAHGQYVYFGRLRPESILVDDEGCPVIAELGASADATREQGKVYVAPEARLSGAGDARADVFAIGRLIHFLLIERDPTDSLELLPALDELCELPAGLVRIVRRCLSTDPGTRYRSVASLAADLGRYTEAERVGLGHPHGKERARPRSPTPPPKSLSIPPSAPRTLPAPPPAAERQLGRRASGVIAKVAVGVLAFVGVGDR